MSSSNAISAIALALVTAAAGCSKDAKPAAEKPGAAAADTPGASAPAIAAAKHTDETFEVEIRPEGSYTAETPGEARVVLVAKEGFKCNDQYPYKFEFADSDGISYSDKVVRGDDAISIEGKKAVMKVPFTPSSAGKHTVKGKFSFSVCSDDKCLIEKRDLELAIDVR